jgi:hypothetical protein
MAVSIMCGKHADMSSHENTQYQWLLLTTTLPSLSSGITYASMLCHVLLGVLHVNFGAQSCNSRAHWCDCLKIDLLMYYIVLLMQWVVIE